MSKRAKPRVKSAQLITQHLDEVRFKTFRERKWGLEHCRAFTSPKQNHPEWSLVYGIEAWAVYADFHYQRYEAPISEDQILGKVWRGWGESLRRLLVGETGRLDAGTLNSLIWRILEHNGFTPED